AAIPVAARTEHHDQASVRERTQCRKRALECIRRVRVVAQHGAWNRGESLESAGYLRRRCELVRDLVWRKLERDRNRRSRERIGDVVRAEQRQRDRYRAGRRLEPEPRTAPVDLQL